MTCRLDLITLLKAFAAILLLQAAVIPFATADDAGSTDKAVEAAPADDKKLPIGQLLELTSPITDEALGAVRKTALELQRQAAKEKRPAYLILQLSPGSSQFHHVYALADFLASEPLTQLTTVAWVPEDVFGNNVFVALACQEIVMHPDAHLGDIGRGEALRKEDQDIVRGIIAKRRNAKVTPALVAGLMNPSETILHLTVDQGDGIKEKRLATAAEAAQLRDQGVVISDSKTLKDQGTPWKISGAEAREEDILITQTAGSTRDVIDAYGLPLEALRNRITGETIDKVAYIELKDTIDDQFYSFAIRQIQRAVNQNVELIIFEIDSPGGGLLHSADIANTIANLREKDIKTVAFVREQAYSGGTIVALGCDEIYMLPEATIGDAIPVLFLEGQALKDTEGKVLSAERELMHQLAERKNRPPALLEAIADIDLEVFEVTHRKTGRVWFMSEAEIHASGEEWLQGPLVPETRKGVALTVGGRRAAELRIAEPPVTDLEDLRARLGIPQDIKFRRIERTWVDHVVFNLNGPAMTGLLFFIGVICIYLELHTMTGFFGIISVLAFGVFFWSKIMGGTAGGLEVILFLIGIGCLALEIFVIPGFGVFGISGILLLLVSLVMASQTFGGITAEYDLIQAGRSVAMFGVALFAVMVTGLLLSSFLPKIPFLRGMILDPPGGLAADGPRLRPELAAAAHPLMASRGRSVTVLRPAGKARLDGQIVDVISDGPFIMEDKDIEVVRITGNRIVVREVQA